MAPSWMGGSTLTLAAAFIVRLALIAWGDVQDERAEVKYTDVDYWVFTDGAREMLAGQSPFERATYRYTPLMAALAVPNMWHPWAAKVLFAAVDIGIAVLLLRVLDLDLGLAAPSSTGADGASSSALSTVSLLFLLSPVVINVSTRGSSDGVVTLLVLAALHAAKYGGGRRLALVSSGLLLGTAIHVKLYPVVFTLPLMLYQLVGQGGGQTPSLPPLPIAVRVGRALAFLLSTVAAFATLTAGSAYLYGQPYLHHALLYHFSRADVRHNFAPAFLAIYLGDGQGEDGDGAGAVGAWAKLAFLPQLATVALLGVLWCRNPSRALFFQCAAFVALNKVITAQYFTWWMALLPLAVAQPQSEGSGSAKPGRAMAAGAVWLVAELAWGANAYWLELEGQDHFLGVALGGAALLAASTALLVSLLR